MTGYDGYRDWKGWTGRPFGECSRSSAIYFSEELRHSGVTRIAGMSVLEIGFGNGEFARWVRDSGASYVGTELISELVQEGVLAGFDVRNANEPLERLLGEGSIDLVAAFDVFEHFEAEAFRSALHSIYRALRPSGRLIARVPSGDSPFSRAIQNGDATHSLAIGSSMVTQFANEAGLVVNSLREPAMHLLGLGAKTFLRRAAVQSVRRVMFPIFTRAFMG